MSAVPGTTGLVLAGPWRTVATASDDQVYVQHGPAPSDDAALVQWLRRGCSGRIPLRQGFVAVLTRPDGSVLAATSSRQEIAAFHTLDNGRLVLATHPRELIGAMSTFPELDIQKMADLGALWDDPATTVYSGVSRVPIGHTLSWRPGQRDVRISRWFRPEDDEPLRIDPEAAPAAMRLAVLGAVEASLPADGDVAALLSGGLDSSTVVACAAAALSGQGRTTHTMTHVPLPGTANPSANWEASDWPYVERMIGDVSGLTGHQLVNAQRRLPLEAVTEGFDLTWLPIRNPANFVWFTAASQRAARQGWPLLLTGASGNGPFSRDSAGIVAQLVAARQVGALARYTLARHRTGEPWPTVASSVARQALPSWSKRAWRRVRPLAVRDGGADLEIRMPFRREALSPQALEHLDRMRRPADQPQDWRRLVLRDGSLTLMGQRLIPTLWRSDPLSDPEVVRLALRLPLEAWVCSGVNRGLAREAARDLVPDYIRLRRTRGAQSADVHQWMQGRERYFEDAYEVLAQAPHVEEFIDLGSLRKELDRGFHTSAEATQWQITAGRALALGNFAVWHARRRRSAGA